MMPKYISMRRVQAVNQHPNADNLAVVKIDQYTVCYAKELAEQLRVGELVMHVPPGVCINPDVAVTLEVDKYLKKCQYKNQGEEVPCLVQAARLRSVPSMGFIIPGEPPSKDLDHYFGTWKYEPAEYTLDESELMEFKDHPQFPRYTRITRMQLNPDAWVEGLPVRITEKVHGMNTRFGVVQVNGEWRFMVGSYNAILREYHQDKRSPYWEMLDARIMELLNTLCDGEVPVVIYAEILGPKIQDLDYGLSKIEIRVFDILVDGKFLPWDLVSTHCQRAKLITVPLLHTGKFMWCQVDAFTKGTSIVCNPSQVKSHFKDREGIVITPLEETNSPILGGRLIGKSINVDYESRRGGTEFH